ncbi:MAG: C4-type zinc ribbon domain-containing protein [Helicobacteraceae bacterium]|jgi:predicted  nucleic acid-binding Zn-ribbon protein|nr:C4-type zinc ribbon domain-containing protein [Helicobacteraceae bacterium]
MNKHLKQLIELSDLDKSIDEFIPEEERINGALNDLVAEREKASRQIDELENLIVDTSYKIDKQETALVEHRDKIARHESKSESLKTEREIKALGIEQDIAKEQINFINDEIERLQKSQEDSRAKIADLKSRIAAIENDIKQAKSESKEALASLADRKEVLLANRAKLVEDIPQKVFAFYEKIRRWAGNRAVAPVKKQACYSCFMKISDKVYGEVIASSEIVTCPNCGCILYVAQE